MRPVLVCVSGGGFLAETKGLISSLERQVPLVYVLLRVERKVMRSRLTGGKFFLANNMTRGHRYGLSKNPIFWAMSIRRLMRKMRIHRPEFVIANGSVESLPVIIAAKILGAKVIFFESITRPTSLSRTGRLVYNMKLYDYFFVQWPQLSKYYKRAKYEGIVLPADPEANSVAEPGFVLVTVGSVFFDELIQRVDRFFLTHGAPAKILFQIGSGTYIPKSGNYIRYSVDLLAIMARSELVITHGGFTVLEAARLRKKVIAVPNPNLPGNHQRSFVNEIANILNIEVAQNLEEIDHILQRDIQPARQLPGGYLGDFMLEIILHKPLATRKLNT